MDQQERHWARQALQRLEKEGLPPTPNFYAVFYSYFAAKNAKLTAAIEQVTAQFGSISLQQANDLYQEHLGLESEQKALAAANNALEDELRKVMQLIEQASTDTQKFDSTLTGFVGDLRVDPPSVDKLRAVVSRVAQETKAIAEQNQRLQNQLQESTSQISELRQNLDKTMQEALLDPLTEVGNRKFFDSEIERLVAETAKTGEPLSLCLIDIDYFKKFNDTYGHQVGDQVLKLVGRTLRENIKGRDVVARYGGEEFAVVLPQTRLEDAGRVANLLRVSVGNKKIMRRNSQESLGVITMSVGVTQYKFGENIANTIERADQALYQAKQDGRNRVTLAALPS